MSDIFSWLFAVDMDRLSSSGWVPSWMWIAYHFSNLVIALGQFSIPLMMVANWQYRRDGVSPRLFWSVTCFLPAMAASRLIRVFDMWGMPYHLATIMDTLTAAFTVYSVVQLPKLARHVLKLPSREAMHDALNAVQVKAIEKDLLNLAVAKERDDVTRELALALDRLKDLEWNAKTRDSLDYIHANTKASLDHIHKAVAIIRENKEIAANRPSKP